MDHYFFINKRKRGNLSEPSTNSNQFQIYRNTQDIINDEQASQHSFSSFDDFDILYDRTAKNITEAYYNCEKNPNKETKLSNIFILSTFTRPVKQTSKLSFKCELYNAQYVDSSTNSINSPVLKYKSIFGKFDKQYTDYIYMSYNDGSILFCYITNNMIWKGELFCYDGNVYKITFSKDYVDRNCIRIHPNGSIYDGFMNNMEASNVGTLFRRDNSYIYSKFVKNIHSTSGSFYYPQLYSYLGCVSGILPSGSGCCIDKDKNLYYGLFQSGIRHGKGVCILKDDTKISGIWSRNRLHNQMEILYDTFESLKGVYYRGNCQGHFIYTFFNEHLLCFNMYMNIMSRLIFYRFNKDTQYYGTWYYYCKHGFGLDFTNETLFTGYHVYNRKEGYGSQIYLLYDSQTDVHKYFHNFLNSYIQSTLFPDFLKQDLLENESLNTDRLFNSDAIKIENKLLDRNSFMNSTKNYSFKEQLDLMKAEIIEQIQKDAQCKYTGLYYNGMRDTMKHDEQCSSQNLYMSSNSISNSEMLYSNDCLYNGSMQYDDKYGDGQFKCNVYEYNGEWKNDMMNGYGQLIYNNNCLDHDQDYSNIFCRKHYTYEGDFLNGFKHGKGKIKYYTNGYTYDGEWKYDKKHGEGIETRIDGKKYKVLYKNNILIDEEIIES